MTTCWGESLRHPSATSQQTRLGNKQYPVGAKHGVGVKGKAEFRFRCSGCCRVGKRFRIPTFPSDYKFVVNSCDRRNLKIILKHIIVALEFQFILF